MAYKILVLKGDGIGPEVVGEALQILKIIARLSAIDLEFKEGMIGGHALDTAGTPLPDDVIKHAQDSDAILLGAVGGPKWDNPRATVRPEQALLGLRNDVGLLAEGYDPLRRRFAGNYPLAGSHIALIMTAQALTQNGQFARSG